MINLKEWVNKITNWISGVGFGNPADYTSALFSATQSAPWTAPASGIMVYWAGTNGGVRAYWYVNDATDGRNMARATRLETTNYNLGASFPVIKGHQYYSVSSGIASDKGATLYKIVGG